MSDLADFLLARIAEDEAEALSALPGDHLIATGSVWSPVRALTECDAKRRIVAFAIVAKSYATRATEMRWPAETHLVAAVAYEDAMKALALPYADHPDYRQEWKP